MIQEDVEHKSAVLIIKGTKITARLLAKTMLAALRLIKRARDAPGKKSIKQLSKGGALESVPIKDENIKAFDPIARKYGVSTSICYWVRSELGISEEIIPIINDNGFQCLGYQRRLFDDNQ